MEICVDCGAIANSLLPTPYSVLTSPALALRNRERMTFSRGTSNFLDLQTFPRIVLLPGRLDLLQPSFFCLISSTPFFVLQTSVLFHPLSCPLRFLRR
jgi:hypothetical protein